jgi:hypothetical protein
LAIHRKGFKRSSKKGDPTCRWYIDTIQFDIVPIVPCGTHTSNRWYEKSLDNIQEIKLGSTQIRHLDPVFFIASKLEAFYDRGEPNNLISANLDDNHDLEDIIILIDGRSNILQEIKQSNESVMGFIKSKFLEISQLSDIEDYIRNCLPQHSIDEKVKRIFDIMKSI